MGVIMNHRDIFAQAGGWREQNLRVVLTNGCFDLLHAGHLQTFREAKKMGDLLVVGINSDRSVRSLKGETRPIISQSDRCLLLAALEPVDVVTIFDELTADRLLSLVHPHIYVKGSDYTLDSLPEKETLIRLGIEVRFTPMVRGISTTEIIQRIKVGNFG